MARIFLIRHGQADYDQADSRGLKGMGRDLVPLTLEGIRQVERLADRFPFTVTLLLSSPMTRALQTAAILGAHWAIAPTVEFDLHEWVPDTTYNYASSKAARDAYFDFRLNGGTWKQGAQGGWEERRSVTRRVEGVLSRYGAESGTIALVCHGVVIEVLTGRTVYPGQWTEYSSTARPD